MSLALAHAAGRLKPEERLADSINKFRNILSNEQRAAFDAGRDLAAHSSPQLRDVMHVTAEIDRQARVSTGGRRRCFGPRLTKFLQSIQEFVVVGDIVFGGSQNLIACGVWSLVRLSLLTVARFSTYLEKLSELLMVVGKAAPRYQAMVEVHPGSRALQKLGIEYMIALVDLCSHVVTICNKSIISQLKTFFKDFDISSHQSELLKWTDTIKEQLNLEEAKANSRARSMLSRSFTVGAAHRKLRHRATLLNACSTFDYQTAWKQARKCGYASWYLDEEIYQHWRDHPSSSTITVSGKLGAGKTVVLANMLNDVILNTKDYTFAYFFCRSDHTESRKYRTVIGCLARQILETVPIEEVAKSDSWLQSKLSLEDIKQLFTLDILRSKHIFIMLDGIDECEHEDRSHIIEFLKQLRTCSRLKTCVSYRLTANTPVRDELADLGPNETLHMPQENPDIISFIAEKLESCLKTKKLTVGNPQLILEISQALETGAQGMFLWVVLQIETICAQKTDKEIREALRHLPKDLPETFARILALAKKSEPVFQERLLKLLLAAVRPLTIDELREALSVTPFRQTWDPSNLINDIQPILSAGGSLLVVDEEEFTVHFIHPSVNQFLLGDFGPSYSFYVEPSLADLEMAQTTVTYLSYNVFDRQVARVPGISGFTARKFYENIVSSTLTAPLARSMALSLLRLRRRPDFDVGKVLSNLKPTTTKSQTDFAFYQYASANWIEHTKATSSGDDRLFSMIRKVLDRSQKPMLITFGNEDGPSHIQGPREWDIYLQLCPQTYNASLFRRPRKRNNTLDVPVLWAIENSHLGIFRAMIRKSIRNIMHVIAYLRCMHNTGRQFVLNNLEPHLYAKLFCLSTLFGYYGISNRFLDITSPTLLVTILDAIPLVPLNGLAVALILVRIQACHVFGGPSLKVAAVNKWDDIQHEDGDEDEDEDQDGRQFRTCCDVHVGVFILNTRLCACYVPPKYRRVVGHLGDFDLEKTIPFGKAEEAFCGSNIVCYGPNRRTRVSNRRWSNPSA
ncbi:hypothetical protein GGR51DRAFT_561794 [Nemania sp. FL0031]|nr:hypothetical protein GGR51DRAFT_561794 [Nemania sp. FL0031]